MRIAVYETTRVAQSDEGQEAVKFDHALLFERTSGQQFCIAIDDNSIAGELFFCQTASAMAETLQYSTARQVLH